jgi:Zn-dependent protease
MDFSITDLLIIIPVIIISMGLHEAMHALVAHRLGDTTASDMGRITLNPLKHIDLVTTVALPVLLIIAGLPPIFAAKPVPFNPMRVKWDEYGAALIGIAGPFTNLAIAIAVAVAYRLLAPVGLMGDIFLITIVINCSFFVFNMLPIPPLDGSRLLYAVAPEPLQELMATIERAGFFVLLAILFLLLPVISPVVNNGVDTLLRLLVG